MFSFILLHAAAAASVIDATPEEAASVPRRRRKLVTKKTGALDEQSSPASCVPEGHDPYDPREKGGCCPGLEETLKDWNNTGEQSYRCEPTPTPTSDSLCSDVVCEAKEVIFSGDDKKYACGNPANTTGNTLVCYPKKGKPKHHLPVVFYNRDSGGWTESSPYYSNKGNRAWLTTMAEQCLITIAPMTLQHNPPTNKCKHNHDSFLAFDFLLKNQNNWNVTWGIKDVTPDWKRIAVAGQSSGAHHLPRLQKLMGESKYKKRMKAVLYGHGGSFESDKPKYKPDLNECLRSKDKWCDDIPAMFLTATNDNDVPNERTFHWYQKLTHPRTGVDDTGVDGSTKVPVTNAVYAQVPGKHDENNHMEPIYPGGGAFNDYAARFLACHLYKGAKDKKSSTRSLEACAWIYGGNGKLNICNSTEVKDLVDTGGVNGKKGRHLVYDGRKMC